MTANRYQKHIFDFGDFYFYFRSTGNTDCSVCSVDNGRANSRSFSQRVHALASDPGGFLFLGRLSVARKR